MFEDGVEVCVGRCSTSALFMHLLRVTYDHSLRQPEQGDARLTCNSGYRAGQVGEGRGGGGGVCRPRLVRVGVNTGGLTSANRCSCQSRTGHWRGKAGQDELRKSWGQQQPLKRQCCQGKIAEQDHPRAWQCGGAGQGKAGQQRQHNSLRP